jgi:hypothetical protein
LRPTRRIAKTTLHRLASLAARVRAGRRTKHAPSSVSEPFLVLCQILSFLFAVCLFHLLKISLKSLKTYQWVFKSHKYKISSHLQREEIQLHVVMESVFRNTFFQNQNERSVEFASTMAAIRLSSTQLPEPVLLPLSPPPPPFQYASYSITYGGNCSCSSVNGWPAAASAAWTEST